MLFSHSQGSLTSQALSVVDGQPTLWHPSGRTGTLGGVGSKVGFLEKVISRIRGVSFGKGQ